MNSHPVRQDANPKPYGQNPAYRPPGVLFNRNSQDEPITLFSGYTRFVAAIIISVITEFLGYFSKRGSLFFSFLLSMVGIVE